MSSRVLDYRVSKASSSSKKSEERHRLFRTIETDGFEVNPCSLCKSKGWACRMIQGISRCSACVKRGRRCISARVTTNTQPSRVIAEGKKLQAQERDAEEALVKAFRKVEEALAHLNHLRKHRELLTEGTKTMDVGLEAPYIGVEEDVEEEERVSLNRVMAEKSEAVVTASGVRNS